ncbi:hypothetical protein D3C72_1204640 [compost metagenome]
MLRHGQQAGRARGIVDGAVVDRISRFFVTLTLLAQVIPVAAVDDGFILQCRIRARHHAGDVELFHLAHGGLHFTAQLGVQCDGLEVLAFRLGAQGIQVLAAGREQAARRVFRDPALQRRAGRAVGQLKTFAAAPAVLHHAPVVRGRRFRVDQQDASRALAPGFLEFVGPAAVIGQRLAGKAVRIKSSRLRVVDHHDDDLVFDIDTLEIVPTLFRRRDAVADKYQWRVERVRGNGVARGPDPVRTEGQRHGLAAGHRLQAAILRQGFHAGNLHALAVAVAAHGFQAGHLRLGFQVRHRQVGAALARAAAFQQIVGQEGQVGAQGRFLHHGQTGRGVGGKRQRGQGQGRKQLLHKILWVRGGKRYGG